MIALNDVEFSILDLVTDDSYTLFEVWWSVQSDLPNRPADDLQIATSEAFQRLFALGLIEVFWCGSDRNVIRPILPVELAVELPKPEHWDFSDPTNVMDPPWIGCYYTPKGHGVLEQVHQARAHDQAPSTLLDP